VGEFITNPGGKGANQAVAAAGLNGEVTFVAKVGNDIFAREAIKGLKEHGTDTRFVTINNGIASGMALIIVDDRGENCISVASGANMSLQKPDIDNVQELIEQASFITIQVNNSSL
jgi:ribokinase